jgi:RNA polymerase sigma-70 factor (ECF subfamily)
MDPKQNLARLDAPDTATDLDLARRVAASDHDALRSMMRQHNQTLFRTARSILRDDAEAEDVVQEAYLLAYRSIGEFRGEARLSTWLIRIVVNLAIRRKQRQTRDQSLHADTADEEAQKMSQSRSPGPEATASTAELRRFFICRRALRPHRCRRFQALARTSFISAFFTTEKQATRHAVVVDHLETRRQTGLGQGQIRLPGAYPEEPDRRPAFRRRA